MVATVAMKVRALCSKTVVVNSMETQCMQSLGGCIRTTAIRGLYEDYTTGISSHRIRSVSLLQSKLAEKNDSKGSWPLCEGASSRL